MVAISHQAEGNHRIPVVSMTLRIVRVTLPCLPGTHASLPPNPRPPTTDPLGPEGKLSLVTRITGIPFLECTPCNCTLCAYTFRCWVLRGPDQAVCSRGGRGEREGAPLGTPGSRPVGAGYVNGLCDAGTGRDRG